MANKISLSAELKDNASNGINKLAGNVNSFSKKIKETTKPLNNLAKSFQNLNSSAPGIAAIGFAVSKVTQSVKGAVSEMLEWEKAFAEVEVVAKRIDFASSINKNLGKTSTELKQFAEDTSASLKNAVSADEINAEIAKLSFDKTGEQIEDIIGVALDLSAALGIDLDTAVTQLNQTFSGSVGTLGKYFPELKNINEEGLQAGVAVDLLKSKVGGLSAELSNTAQGSLNSYKNSVDNFKESLGELVTDFLTPLRNELASLFADLTNDFNKFNQWIKDKKRISTGGATREEAETQVDLWKAKAKKYKEDRDKQAALLGWDEEAMAHDTDYQRSLQNINYALQQMQLYQSMIDELDARSAAEAQKPVTAEDFKVPDQYLKTSSASTPGSSESDPIYTVENGENPYEKTMKGFIEEFKNNATDYFTSDEADNAMLRQTIDEAEARGQAEEQQRMQAEQEAIEEAARLQAEKLDQLKESLKETVLDNTGEIGSYIKAYEEGGGTGVLIQFAGEILEKLSETSGIVNSFYNIVSTLIEEFIEPLAALIEPILNPLLVAVQSVGKTVASMLTTFTPLFEVWGKHLEITSAVMVWQELFLTAFYDSVYQAFTEVANVLIDIYNNLNGWGTDLDKKSGKGWDAIGEEWSNLIPSNFQNYYQSLLSDNATNLLPASTSTSGATYTAARDITVNINYVQSFVNGDAETIAVKLAKEIRNAEKLGLISA